MSTLKHQYKQSKPSFPSSRFGSASGSNLNGLSSNPMRTHAYSRLTQKPTSLYDKTYAMAFSPLKNGHRIVKNKANRRRSMEVNKFSSLDQREQYRRLIEQYRTSTLKETSVIFGLTGKKQDREIRVTHNHDTIIDLTEKTSPEAGTMHNRSRFDAACTRKTLKELHNIEQRKITLKSASVSKENGAVSNESVRDNRTSFMKVQMKQFSSPYMSKDFIPDLIKRHNQRERQRKIELCAVETRAKLLRDKREAKEAMLAEILHKKLQLKEKQVQEEEIEKLTELTHEMNNVINEALVPYPAHEVLSEKFNISITREHISTLFGLNWLNDEIINFYMELIVQRSKDRDDLPSAHAMNTFFYPRLSTQSYKSVRRWTKKVDIFSKDIVLFPIHLGVHWCLAVADFMKKEIRYYDSMGGSNRECLETLKNYLVSEHENKRGSVYDVSDWQLLSMSSIPQQMNGSDCGVFTCKFAEYIAFKANLSFIQADMPYFRRAMVWEIINKELLR